MAFVEDLAPFFSDFAEAATLAGQPVQVIYEEPHELAAGIGMSGMAGSAPQVRLATASVPASPYGAALVIPGRGNFRVLQHLPDGTGVSTLALERAA